MTPHSPYRSQAVSIAIKAMNRNPKHCWMADAPDQAKTSSTGTPVSTPTETDTHQILPSPEKAENDSGHAWAPSEPTKVVNWEQYSHRILSLRIRTLYSLGLSDHLAAILTLIIGTTRHHQALVRNPSEPHKPDLFSGIIFLEVRGSAYIGL